MSTSAGTEKWMKSIRRSRDEHSRTQVVASDERGVRYCNNNNITRLEQKK